MLDRIPSGLGLPVRLRAANHQHDSGSSDVMAVIGHASFAKDGHPEAVRLQRAHQLAATIEALVKN